MRAAGPPQGPSLRSGRRLRDYSPWLLATGLLLLLQWSAPAWLHRLDLLAYDLLLPRRAAAVEPALVVAIDDASLARLGRWPWPRSVHADLIERLHAAGARSIAMAIMFAEPDPDPAGDMALAQAMQRQGAVLLPLVPVLGAGGTVTEGLPTPALRAGAAALGHVDLEIDLDGQVRRVFLRGGASESRYPALGLAVYQAIAGNMPDAGLPGRRRGPAAPVADAQWVRDFEVLLPAMPPLPRISFIQALDGDAALAQVRGRAVFVGFTASGLGGELASPLQAHHSTVAAVDLHAHVFESLRAHALVTPAAQVAQLGFGLLLVASLALWPLGRARHAGLCGLALATPLLASVGLLHVAGWWLEPVAATLALLSGFALWLGHHLRRSRRALMRTRQHAQATLAAIGDGVITVDRQGLVQFANQQALAQFGPEVQRGRRLVDALGLAGDGMTLLSVALEECLRDAMPVRLSSHIRTAAPDGARDLRASVSPLRGPAGELEGAVLVLNDVSDAVASANRLQYAATHDALTRLPNRVLLHERIGLALARVQRHGSSLALLFLDLDRFKRINDSLGHRQGDEVLRIMAERLKAIFRSTDFVARWGGDEFVVLMEDVSGPDAVALAAAKVVAALREDVETNGTRLASSCSVGIAMAPQDGIEIDGLLAKADTAMYRAKSHPDTGFHFYSSELKIWTREYLGLEVDLRAALRENRFELHYQPQYTLRDGALVGYEALLRWRRTPEALVQPDQFIGVAEETGLIVEIGAWVVLQVARDLASALAAGRPALPVAVNVSARQCVNHGIVDVVRAALQETGIPSALLKLEITETTAMTDAAQVAVLLREISALGVRIAVDDFGTGYSSLAYLKRFPIDELKIDKSFVQDIATDADDAAIVRATIALAHELGIMVVAEGVETEAQSQFLTAQHCDIAQGYLYGRPQPLERREPPDAGPGRSTPP